MESEDDFFNKIKIDYQNSEAEKFDLLLCACLVDRLSESYKIMNFYKNLLEELKAHVLTIFESEFTNDKFGAEHQILEKYNK